MNDHILFEILCFCKANELDRLKIINYSFNQLITNYFHSKPLFLIDYGSYLYQCNSRFYPNGCLQFFIKNLNQSKSITVKLLFSIV